jgi:hypothetical protein
MGTKWHGFVATDTVKNPALMPKYTTILRVAKAGRESEGLCRAPGNLYKGWLCTFVSRNVPKRVSCEGPELDALGD